MGDSQVRSTIPPGQTLGKRVHRRATMSLPLGRVYFTVLVHVKALSRDRIVGEGPTTDVLSHPRGECTRAVAGAVTIPDLAIQRARRARAAVKP